MKRIKRPSGELRGSLRGGCVTGQMTVLRLRTSAVLIRASRQDPVSPPQSPAGASPGASMARDASLVPRLFTGATDRTQIAYSEIPDETPSGATLRVAARRPQRLQILPKAPDEADVGEAERAMRGCALFVVGLGIRRELGAPDRTRPPLRGGEELSANAAVPRFGDDEPALEETDTVGLAALG